MNSLQNRFQHLTGFSAVIEQKNIFTLCLNELNTDSTKLLLPKPFVFEFQIKTFQSSFEPRSIIYNEFWFVLAIPENFLYERPSYKPVSRWIDFHQN